MEGGRPWEGAEKVRGGKEGGRERRMTVHGT